MSKPSDYTQFNDIQLLALLARTTESLVSTFDQHGSERERYAKQQKVILEELRCRGIRDKATSVIASTLAKQNRSAKE